MKLNFKTVTLQLGVGRSASRKQRVLLECWEGLSRESLWDFRDIHARPCILKRTPLPFCSLVPEFFRRIDQRHNRWILHKGNARIHTQSDDRCQTFSRTEGHRAQGQSCKSRRGTRVQKERQTDICGSPGHSAASVAKLVAVTYRCVTRSGRDFPRVYFKTHRLWLLHLGK